MDVLCYYTHSLRQNQREKKTPLKLNQIELDHVHVQLLSFSSEQHWLLNADILIKEEEKKKTKATKSIYGFLIIRYDGCLLLMLQHLIWEVKKKTNNSITVVFVIILYHIVNMKLWWIALNLKYVHHMQNTCTL